ncbi:MAG TPA: class I SAM-dependent methyltransferase [Polyangiaceae bacterium]|nr:class I SAM-dependent methyltransferase [Polyangiaceae bacterium]
MSSMDPSLRQKIASRLRPESVGSYSDERGQFVVKEFPVAEVQTDFLNGLKDRIKRRLGWLYPTLIRLLSPVYEEDPVPRFLSSAPADAFIVNLGSGTHAYPATVNVDGVGYSNVHVVCDLEVLPFSDESVDRLLSIAVLEHVSEPERHIAEFRRVLKPGGSLLVYIPFLQPFHASPHDYRRYTDAGMRQLFSDFNQEVVKVGGGPTSALIWTLQEWLAMTLSFGSLRLYHALQPLFWILSPLKLFDFFLTRHPAASIAASGFYLEARKADR